MTNNIRTEYVQQSTQYSNTDYKWYAKKEDVFQSVIACVNKIDSDNTPLAYLNVRHARLYSNSEILSYLGIANQRPKSPQDDAITYNIVKSCIDTVSSKIAKNKPKPQFLTSGGDYKQKEKAKKLTKYIEGVFYSCNYYTTVAKAFIDACVFGTGFVKFFNNNGKIDCERVLPVEIKVDANDGLYGQPRCMYQVKLVARDALIDTFPEFEQQILSVGSATPIHQQADLVRVIEAWYIGTNGKHVICLDNCTLLDESYEESHFPFVIYRWSDKLTGFYGTGIAEELVGTQIEINKLLRNISLAQRLVAVPRVMIDSASDVSSAQLNNEIASIIKYKAGTQQPTFITPTAMNPEVYNHLKWLIQSGYEKTGISQLSATSKKPSGLDSAVALREYSDIETERFMLTAQRFEQLALDSAKIIINMSKSLYSQDKNLSTKIIGKGFIESIKWKDVDLEEDQYIMQLFPVGLLPSTPAGKVQKVQEMVAAGWIDKDKAMDLLDFPDIEQYQSLELANNNLIEKNINYMLDTDYYLPPEPQMDLAVAGSMAHKYYLRGRVDGLPEEKLELLLRFIDDCERLAKQKAQADVPVVAQVQPLAQPAPLPESDLLPMVDNQLPNV